MEIASGPSEENKKDENMEELDKTYVKLSHDDAPGKGKLNKGIYYICGSIFVVGLIFFFFSGFKLIIEHYHTQKQKKIKFKLRIKLNHSKHMHTEKLIILVVFLFKIFPKY